MSEPLQLKECICGTKFVESNGIVINNPPIYVVYCSKECGEKNGWVDYTLPRW